MTVFNPNDEYLVVSALREKSEKDAVRAKAFSSSNLGDARLKAQFQLQSKTARKLALRIEQRGHRALVSQVRAKDAAALAAYTPTPTYSAGVYRCRTHSAGNDPADMLVLYGARCRRTLALAQLDPLDFDEFAEDLCYTRGGPREVAAIIDGLLAVAQRAANWDDSDHIARALMGRDARRALAALAHITGDEPATAPRSTP